MQLEVIVTKFISNNIKIHNTTSFRWGPGNERKRKKNRYDFGGSRYNEYQQIKFFILKSRCVPYNYTWKIIHCFALECVHQIKVMRHMLIRVFLHIHKR